MSLESVLKEMITRIADIERRLDSLSTKEAIQNIDDARNVTIASPSNSDLLFYDSTSSKWGNLSASEGGLSEIGHTHAAPPAPAASIINFGSVQEIILASGAFALVSGKSFYEVESEAGITDDLDTISGGSDGDMIVLCPENGHTITVTESGNIALDGASETLDAPQDKLTLFYHSDTSKWCAISFSGNS